MKIWIINHYAYTPDLSAGTRHWSICRALREKGHEALVIACSFYHKERIEVRLKPGEKWLRSDIDGALYHFIRGPAYRGNGIDRVRNMVVFAIRVAQEQGMVELAKPDLIVGTSPSPFTALAALFLARRFNVPFILEVVDLWPESIVQFGGISRYNPFVIFLNYVERYLYRRADAVFSHLSGVPKYAIAKGARKNSTYHIPIAIPIDPIPLLKETPMNNRFTFLYAGAHGIYNNLDLILDAAEILQQDGWEDLIEIQFLGNGPLKNQLKEKVNTKKINLVRFFDPVPKTKVYERMAQADAFVWVCKDSPIYKYGANPNKIYDYLLVGRPILLGAKLPGNPIDAVEAGLSVEAKNDPSRIAEGMKYISQMSREERLKMGLRGYNYVIQNHTMDIWMDRFFAMVRDVYNKHSFQ